MIQTSNSRVQLSLNGSYDKSLSTSSRTIRLVNRIRRLSPANWRRRSHSSSSRNSYNSLMDPSSYDTSSTETYNTAQTVPDHVSRPLTSNRRTIKRYHSSTSVGDFKNSEHPQDRNRSHYSLRELYDLVQPDINVWDLKKRFPTTFLNLITSYMRSIDLSSVEMASLNSYITFSNDDSLIQTLLKQKTQKPRKNSQTNNLYTWARVINYLISYLLKNKNYAVKFILRKPGNHIAINEFEQTLLKIIETHPNPNSLPNIEPMFECHDIHVISCVLTRLLRKNGPLFPEILSNIFLQISNSTTTSPDDQIREQKKSLRMLFLLHSETMRCEILKPLCLLLKSISEEMVCQVDSKSLSVLFSPIFFINQNNSRPSDIQNPDFSRAVQMLMTIIQANEVESLFNVPKLFTIDCVQNLNLNIEAFKKNDKELPPLYCSLRYCMPISPSPSKSQKKTKIQRNNAFNHRTSPVSQKLSNPPERMPRSEKKRGLEEEPVQFRESLLAPMLKKPIVMVNGQILAGNQPKIIKCEKSHETVNPFAPQIRNALLDTQLNFRIRRRPSHVKLNKNCSSNTSLSNTSNSLSGIFDCIKGNKENEMFATP